MNEIKSKLMSRIGLLEWAELHQDDCKNLMMWCHNYRGRGFLSPDVYTLHIVWTNEGSDEVCHEMADYPDKLTMHEFLNDSWDTHDGAANVFKFLSDYRDVTAHSVRTIRMNELCE